LRGRLSRRENRMNPYQKLATLLFRLFGAAVAAAGVMGPLYIVFLMTFGISTPNYGHDRWLGSAVWFMAGILLIVFSAPLGRLFGRGLD